MSESDRTLIGACGLAVAIICLGLYIAISGRLSLLSSSHCAKVPPHQRPHLARRTGSSIVVVGVGVGLVLLSPARFLPIWLTTIGFVIMAAGFAGLVASVSRLNGGLVSLLPGTSTPIVRANLQQLLEVMICLISVAMIARITIVPGYRLISTGDLGVLQANLYEHAAAKDLPRLAHWIGFWTIALGIGSVVAAIAGIRLISPPAPFWARTLMTLGAVVFFTSIACTMATIAHFNGYPIG